ncbi:MAG TPA: adenylate/guanylate cyclase domain-containing protein [Thermoanaerobaculia bacterium]
MLAGSERREVTVVFVDASNFTAASRLLDSEDVYLFIDEAMRLLAEVVQDYEGTIDKFTGDGLMALFGVPMAHEDDAERGVRAAWDMQRVVRPFRERVAAQHGFDFRVRIGVHTGEVVAGQIGNILHTEYTVIGDTVNLASRLQAAAEPDEVYVSASTYERTLATIAYEPVGPLTLKGIPGTVTAYRVAGIQPASSASRGLPHRTVPMVGRDAALADLNKSFSEAATHRQFRFAIITGEAGLGKSRLVQEFLRQQRDVSVVHARCVALSRSRPLSILGDLLHSLLDTHPTDPPSALLEAVSAAAERYELPREAIVPYAASVLGLAECEEQIQRQLEQLDETMLQAQTQVAMRQLILSEAAVRPLILFIDDLHWVDSASREFLQFLVQSIGDVPLMMITAARETDQYTGALVTEASAALDEITQIVLTPLSDANAKLLVRQLVPGEEPEVVSLRRAISERAEGNPFYVEELLRMLLDSGDVVVSGHESRVSAQASSVLRNLPNSLRGLILARFDRLPRSPRMVLQRAAVLGRAFAVKLLQHIAPIDTGDLIDALEQLVERGFLREEAFGLDRGFSFCHALLQDAIHSTLLKRDRQDLHFRVAEAIAAGSTLSAAERNETLAHHYAESASPDLAIPYLFVAAEYSARRHANDVCANQCRHALAIAAQSRNVPALTVFKLHLLLGRSLKFLGKLSEAQTTLQEALNAVKAIAENNANPEIVLIMVELMRELGDVKLREGAHDDAFHDLQEASLALAEWHGDSQARLAHAISNEMARVRFRQERLDEALMIADKLVCSLSEDSTVDPATLASAYNIIGGILWQRGKLEAAANYVRQSLDLYHRIGYLFGKAGAHRNLGVLSFARGSWREAADHFERADWLRRETGCMLGRAANLCNLALLRIATGEYEAARRDLARSLKISTQLGEEFDSMNALMTLAHLDILQGQFDAAEELLERLGSEFAETIGTDERARMESLMAMTKAARQSPADALPVAENAVRLAREEGVAETEADCLRILGILHIRNKSDCEAEKVLRCSAEIAARLGDPYRQALALIELGSIASLDPQQRLQHTEEAVRLFTMLGAAQDAHRAMAALELLPRPRSA